MAQNTGRCSANDPLVAKGKESQVRPDLGVGIFYRAEKYYAGVGFNHLLKSEFDYGLADSVRAALENHVNFTGGYFYEVSFDLRVQFSTAIRTDLNKTQIDFAGIAYLKDTMWGGLAFRQGEARQFIVRLQLIEG